MAFHLSLYRAPAGAGPMHEWESEHREPLGSREQVRQAVDAAFPGLAWEDSEGMLSASGSLGGSDPGFEVTLFGNPGELLREVSMYASPPAVRVLMSALALNHCYAQESGDLYFPFEAGDHWPPAAA